MKFLEPVFGVVRGFADVVVRKIGDSEWIAFSRQGAAAGELMFLDLEVGGRMHQIAVCAIESRPVVLDGDMRYRIRLQAQETIDIPYEQQVRRG